LGFHLKKKKKEKVDLKIMLKNCLKSAMWNIEGLTTDKINDPHFLKTISQFSIIGFVESWTNDSDKHIRYPWLSFRGRKQ